MGILSKFRHRSNELERLDTGDYSTEEYDRWLTEMRVIHRVAGEARAIRRCLLDKLADPTVSVLDVGAGTGELLEFVRKSSGGERMMLVGLDSGERSVQTLRDRSVVCVQGSGFELPFADNSFDYVVSSLTFHHFADRDAVRVLREMKRVARIGVHVLDLHRSPIAYYAYRSAGRFLLQEFSLADGSLSILRGFKKDELQSIADEAGLEDIKVRRSWAYRLVLSGK